MTHACDCDFCPPVMLLWIQITYDFDVVDLEPWLLFDCGHTLLFCCICTGFVCSSSRYWLGFVVVAVVLVVVFFRCAPSLPPSAFFLLSACLYTDLLCRVLQLACTHRLSPLVAVISPTGRLLGLWLDI